MGFLNRMQGDKKDNVIKRTGYVPDFYYPRINYKDKNPHIFCKDLETFSSFVLSNLTKSLESVYNSFKFLLLC